MIENVRFPGDYLNQFKEAIRGRDVSPTVMMADTDELLVICPCGDEMWRNEHSVYDPETCKSWRWTCLSCGNKLNFHYKVREGDWKN